jgi:type VI secretion system protein VasI
MSRYAHRALCLVASLTIPGIALQAQSLATCKGIGDSLKRLACYDSLAAGAMPASEKPVADAGEWTVTEKTDPIDDSKTIAAILSSENSVGRLGRNGSLVVRCMKNELDALVSWNAYLSDNRRVTLRFDDQAPETKNWSPATGKTALFATGDVRALVERMANAKKLAIQTTPYDEAPATAVFNLNGGATVLAKVLASCTKQ